MPDVLDLAVVGAGAAGTYVAYHVQRVRGDWSIALFERTNRIGGRLRSLQVDGLDHPIELGGMRFMSSHRRVSETIAMFGLATHAFNEGGGLSGRSSAGRSVPAPTTPPPATATTFPTASAAIRPWACSSGCSSTSFQARGR